VSYATPEEFRNWIGVQGHVDPAQLPHLSLVLSAATQAVDDYCGRTFATTTSSAARIFAGSGRVMIDDAVTVTAVATSPDRVTWTALTTYLLDPPNSTPKTTLVDTPGPYTKVTGTWNYGSTPDNVKLATLMKAAKLWKRRDTPTGVEGFGDFGVVRISNREDSDIVALLANYRRADRVFGIG